MKLILLILIGILLITGNINLPGVKLANPTLFYALGHPFTLFNLLLFILMVWCLSYLGGVIRSIVFVLLLLWVLSLFGIVVTSGFSSLIASAIIVGILLHFLGIM